MAKLNRKQIHDEVRAILDAHPGGMRWADVLKIIQAAHPETPSNSVRGVTHVLFQGAEDIVKIPRGTYQLAKYAEADSAEAAAEEDVIASTPVPADAGLSADSVSEQDFYASFAEWLEENDEVTVAGALGGSSLGGKWGTPDVIGVLKPRAQDMFKFEPQIVTAEIKATPSQPVVAFGQAVAYRLFRTRATLSFQERRPATT